LAEGLAFGDHAIEATAVFRRRADLADHTARPARSAAHVTLAKVEAVAAAAGRADATAAGLTRGKASRRNHTRAFRSAVVGAAIGVSGAPLSVGLTQRLDAHVAVTPERATIRGGSARLAKGFAPTKAVAAGQAAASIVDTQA
jgi:hypothetical protein